MSTTVTYKGNTLVTVSNATKTLTTSGKYLEDDITLVDVSASAPTLQTKSRSYTPSVSTQSEFVTPDSGYDGLSRVDVFIAAISPQKSSSDVTVYEDQVYVPTGYYEDPVLKTVASGTAGTPTATKGTVSNHSIAVTPSVTNTSGYINGGTKTGTAVTVAASELVSGTLSITSSGTKDVTNYASASVASGSATTPATTITSAPTFSYNASTGVVTATNSKTQNVTPTVSAGYVSSGTAGTITVGGSNTFQTRCVVGTFTTGSTAGATNITIPYTGSGYPISATVFITGGSYNPDSASYSAIDRYAYMMWSMSKAIVSVAPAHGTDSTNTADQAVTQTVFKNSASDANNYSRNSSMSTAAYMNSNATGAVHTAVRLKTNTTLSYYTKSTSYGLLPSTSYTYVIVYSA